MTVGELIEKLGAYDRSLPVCLDDWSEGYLKPSQVGWVMQLDDREFARLHTQGYEKGTFVLLG